ncbi:MAG: trypsin-like serine protease [Xanthomonadales bacterium]|nr:trypsin-like serine protease [Xanthomonadales bacterium]MCB1611512.1 trypsin-like serine protease [Xanthomonadales bacterium]
MSSICGISPDACLSEPTVCSGSGVVVAKHAVLTCAHVVPDDFRNFAVFFPGEFGLRKIGIRGLVLSGVRPENYRADLCREVLALVFLAEEIPDDVQIAGLASNLVALPANASFRRMQIEQIDQGWSESPSVRCVLHPPGVAGSSCAQSLITRKSMVLADSNGSSGGGYFVDDRLLSIHVGAAHAAERGFVSRRVQASWLNNYLGRNHVES